MKVLIAICQLSKTNLANYESTRQMSSQPDARVEIHNHKVFIRLATGLSTPHREYLRAWQREHFYQYNGFSEKT